MRWVHGSMTREGRYIWFLVALVFSPNSLRAEFNLSSPGPLSQPHAFIEGSNNCLKCHQEGEQVVGNHCLACHTELESRISRNAGYHGRLDQVSNRCGKCHPDHAGRAFKLIKWEGGKENFDHEQTGFSLKGEHAKVSCDGCHDTRLIKDSSVNELIRKNPKKETYLGLSTTCNTCHFDEHRGQVSKECSTCHNETAWTKAPLFDHRKTDFPLTGKHRSVSCEKCHEAVADTNTAFRLFPSPVRASSFMKLNGIAHGTCEDCHKDVHEGKFGKRCESCHSTENWEKVQNKVSKGREFHEKTRFPLRGAHGRVECTSCHGPFPGQPAKFKGLKFEKCTDCHIDAHLGQMTLTAKGLACDNCHTVDQFKPSTFDLAAHARTRYPLEGAHQKVPCAKCHTQKTELAKRIPQDLRAKLRKRGRKDQFSLIQFKYSSSLAACETCHADPHKGEFSRNGVTKSCASCHQVTSFKEIIFDHNRDCKFPLTGKHAQVACDRCHPRGNVREGRPMARYRELPMECEGCHEDVHAGQFAKTPGSRSVCKTCHTTTDFKKDLLFNHNQTKFTTFPLQGNHSSVKCPKCHPGVTVAPDVIVVKYKGLPHTCEGCHEDEHKGAFKKFEPTPTASTESVCSNCHVVGGWQFARFDHTKTDFPLKASHQIVRCPKCHLEGNYEKRIEKTCGSCHRDVHAGQLGSFCDRCHDETGWASAFPMEAHRRTNFPLTGRHALIPCEECHQNQRDKTFSSVAVDCYACHQADYLSTASKGIDHVRAGFGTTCRTCHNPVHWKPARFAAHDGCFPISHGAHSRFTCADCHLGSIVNGIIGSCSTGTATCTGCHTGAHSKGKMDSVHTQVPGYQYKDQKCYECHRNGTSGG